jgi:hypothetical protein
MTLKQLSLFLENKPGHLHTIAKTLADANINIITLSLADTEQFGIVRLIIKDWERAKATLEKAGFVTNVCDVLAVKVPHTPGGLAQILAAVAGAVNVEYMYGFATHHLDNAIMIFRFSDAAKAVAALQAAGHAPLAAADIF